jgi:hypothetical protein
VLGAVTFTLTVQESPAAIVPFEKEMEAAPAVGEKVGEPQFVVDAPVVEATSMAAGLVGNVSVKATPVRALFKLGFVIVKVSVEVPPARIGLGANSFAILGGFKMVRDAEALPLDPVFVPPFVEDTNPLTF